MIKVIFYRSDNGFSGYEISGHAECGDEGNDIICASVSSAAYMTANTLSEIIKCQLDADVSAGYMSIKVKTRLSDAQQILEGLRLHLEALAADYPNNIKVTLRRCQNA